MLPPGYPAAAVGAVFSPSAVEFSISGSHCSGTAENSTRGSSVLLSIEAEKLPTWQPAVAMARQTRQRLKRQFITCSRSKDARPLQRAGDSRSVDAGARGKGRLKKRGGRRGPVSRVVSRVVISLGRRLPVASCDRPGSHGGPDQSNKAPCLILLPVGFTEPGRSPGLLVRSYRTVSPLPPGILADPRSAVCSLWHFPCPCGRWALPTTVSCGARTFLHATHSEKHPRSDHSALSDPSQIIIVVRCSRCDQTGQAMIGRGQPWRDRPGLSI